MIQIYLNAIIGVAYMLLGIISPKEEFIYIAPSQELINQFLKPEKIILSKNAVYAVDYLPKPYSKKGTVDYTKYLQKVIDENEFIVLPDFPISINRAGLSIGSKKTIVFQKNSQIKYQGPANGKHWDIIKIYNVDDVKIINANIVGSRYSKEKQSGEWSAGISVFNSKNVCILNPKISDTLGDGIFIGSEDGGVSENVQVKGGWINNVRRNGISITSGRNIFLNNILISNTNGTAPEAGIDIEPSIEPEFIENVNLTNIYTFNNKVSGIAVNMNALSTENTKDVKSISITISNHTDVGSAYAFGTSLNENKKLFDAKGVINIINPKWEKSRNDLFWKSNNKQSILINITNISSSNIEKKEKLENFLKEQPNFKLR